MFRQTAAKPPRRRVLILMLAAGAVALLASPQRHAEAQDSPESVVKLVIEYGDGVQKHFTAIAWKEDMTVLDVMNAAQEHRRGIKFAFRGSGATALLTKIDDLENEGSGRNWLYEVNGKLADRSFAIQPVKASDTVLWEFRKYR